MDSFSLWLEFEEYAGGYPGPNNDPFCDFCNVQVRVGNSFYAANVWTFGYVEQACRDNLSGQPDGSPAGWLLPPDLLVERTGSKSATTLM